MTVKKIHEIPGDVWFVGEMDEDPNDEWAPGITAIAHDNAFVIDPIEPTPKFKAGDTIRFVKERTLGGWENLFIEDNGGSDIFIVDNTSTLHVQVTNNPGGYGLSPNWFELVENPKGPKHLSYEEGMI